MARLAAAAKETSRFQSWWAQSGECDFAHMVSTKQLREAARMAFNAGVYATEAAVRNVAVEVSKLAEPQNRAETRKEIAAKVEEMQRSSSAPMQQAKKAAVQTDITGAEEVIDRATILDLFSEEEESGK